MDLRSLLLLPICMALTGCPWDIPERNIVETQDGKVQCSGSGGLSDKTEVTFPTISGAGWKESGGAISHEQTASDQVQILDMKIRAVEYQFCVAIAEGLNIKDASNNYTQELNSVLAGVTTDPVPSATDAKNIVQNAAIKLAALPTGYQTATPAPDAPQPPAATAQAQSKALDSLNSATADLHNTATAIVEKGTP